MKYVELYIDDTSESPVFAMSIVKQPAIEIDFLKFAKESKQNKYHFSSDDKMIITGPGLIPNHPIYRSASQLGGEEGYVTMSEETVRQSAYLFASNAVNNSVTIEHETATDQLTLLESWVVDYPENDKAIGMGFDVPESTWMLSYQIHDTDIWDKVKSGEINGFSIEANFAGKLIEQMKLSKVAEDDAFEMLNTYIND